MTNFGHHKTTSLVPQALKLQPRSALILFSLLIIASLSSQALATDPRVLVFSRTTGFRHDSIPDGIAALKKLGTTEGFAVEASEDPHVFQDGELAQYQAVVFLSTTGDILTREQQEAFERYIRRGGGFAGIHAAADTEYEWPWYGDLVGGYFASHPEIQQAQIRVVDKAHPSTHELPRRWNRRDEWYNYQANPRGEVHVLAVLDEKSYHGGTQGVDHPIAWCHEFDGGRAWYTGGGHTEESYSEPLFLKHILGGIEYAAGLKPGDCGATLDANYEKVILDDKAQNPIALAPADDGRIFYIERNGELRVYLPDNGQVVLAGRLAVSTQQEDGLIGIALDPDFPNKSRIYLFYSPRGPDAVQHVSRFALRENRLDLESEEVILQIPTQREQCCHSGGDLVFGPDGALYIGVGDNTNPFDSDGYTPIDERPERRAWDAQRTAANTRDLRGKILRILPRADGSYTIPAGNLFADRPEDGRPEIYIMGVRNPYRLSLDPKRGWLYWGDVGPDAGEADENRGPTGLDEWNRTREAGNFGWPYCIGDNSPYLDFDFGSNATALPFDCSAPTNTSPNNTGLHKLPPAQPAWIWYPYGNSDAFPQLGDGGGRTAMAGPVYSVRPESKRGLPAYYEHTLFIYEWARGWLRTVHFDETDNILQIDPFLPSLSFKRPIDMEIGPDGSLYMLEWGTGFWGDNEDAQLVRIDYVRGARAPVARGTATPQGGLAPLTVHFNAGDSFAPDPGSVLEFAWDFDGDGIVDSQEPEAEFTYHTNGEYNVLLSVRDQNDQRGTDQIFIAVGNTTPQIRILTPPAGGFFNWGESMDFAIEITDAEDSAIDCDRVVFQTFVGHDEHSHPLDEYAGCSGRFTFIGGHGSQADDLFYTVEARYTDRGAAGVGPLTGRTGLILQPRRKEAEHYTRQSGVLLEETGDELGGGLNVGWIDHGDYLVFAPVNLAGIDSLSFRVASAGPGGRIEVRIDSETGPLLASVNAPRTGNWQHYVDVGTAIEDPGGSHELFLVCKRSPGDIGLFNINWIDFHGRGITAMPITAVREERSAPPATFSLAAAYPNPSNGSVVFGFTLPTTTRTRLDLFDTLGQRVATLIDQVHNQGTHRLLYDTSHLASGLYIYQLSVLGAQSSRALIVVK